MDVVEKLAHHIKYRIGPLGRSALTVFLITRCGDVATMVYKLFLGRELSSIDFGAFDPIFSVLAILALPLRVLFQVGVKSLSRLRALDRGAECRALLLDLTLIAAAGSTVAIIAVFAAKDFILRRLHLDSSFYIYVIAALFVVHWLKPLCRAILQGIERYRLLFVPSVLEPFIALILVFGFVSFMSLGLGGALLAKVLAGLVSVSLTFWLLSRTFRGSRSRSHEELRLMTRGVIPVAALIISGTLLQHFDRLFVRNFFLDHSGGYAAVITVGMVPSYILSPLLFVLFPRAAAEHVNKRATENILFKSACIGLIITTGCAIVFAVISPWVMEIWNPAFRPYAKYVWVYTLAVGFHSVIRIVCTLDIARNQYGSLWILVVPSLTMCAILYKWRNSLSIGSILAVVLCTRVLILLGLAVHTQRCMRNRAT